MFNHFTDFWRIFMVLCSCLGLPEENLSPTKQLFLGEKTRFYQNNFDIKMKYAHRGSEDTPPLDLFPWEERPEVKTLPVKRESSPPNNLATAGPKLKPVKHVTINMPRVPPPSPESLSGKPRSRGRRRRTLQAQHSPCLQCHEEKEVGVLPGISTKLTPVNENQEQGTGSEEILATLPQKSLKKTSTTDRLERRAKLIDKLVDAHGEMKKRHKCPPKHDIPQKEVVIAPFKVVIDEENNSETKSGSLKNDAGSRPTQSTTTKSFTFSYMPSKQQHKKKLPKEEVKACPPEIFNNQARTPRPPNTKKQSIISSFIAVNQSKEIYKALIRENQSHAVDADVDSLNKATDCDDLNQPITLSPVNKVKGRELVKETILSHSAFSDSSQPLVTV